MSRTVVGVVAGLVVAACVVAMLPAQEAARRDASAHAPSPPTALLPYADDADAPYTIDSAVASAADLQPVPDTATDEDTGLRSVLKRGGQAGSAYSGTPPATLAVPPSAYPALPPPTTAPPTTAPPTTAPPTTAPLTAAPPAALSQPFAESQESSLARRPPPPRTSIAPPRTAVGTSTPIARSIQDLAINGRNAALRVDLAGPQGIAVGKPASYVVHVTNESDTPADEVLVRVALPPYVTVAGTQPTKGDATLQLDGQGMPRLLWNIPRVAGRGHETLRLEVVADEGDAFELAIDWTMKPAALRAPVTIKQPQLALSLAGPAEMVYGEEKVFTLTVSNPGNGDAERVIVMIASGAAPAQSIEVGSLPAGAKRELPLQVVASQPGQIELRAKASGEGGLVAETTGKINVRKAELNLSVDAPQLKFAASEATYVVSVTNAGTAAADDVQLAITLPSEAKYVSGIEGAVISVGSVKWKIASLPPGGVKTYEVRLALHAAGLNRFVVQAQAPAAGAASAEAQTQVEAVADLKLAVVDPSGPVATGDDAVYELQVTNRGTRAAQQVRIVMQFGEGLEPTAFEGCQARIVPGQILCQPLPHLGPGEQARLRIRAKAEQAGTHQFRVEVTAAGDDTRLVSEGTTRFFSDAGRASSAARTAQKPTLVPTPSVPGPLR